MANDIKTKVWDLDTAGVVSRSPVIIDGVSITWTATIGTVKQVTLSEVNDENGSAGAEIFFATCQSVTASLLQTQFFPLKGTFPGLHLTTKTSADKILVYTK